jgi:hypothetical protein
MKTQFVILGGSDPQRAMKKAVISSPLLIAPGERGHDKS